MANDELILYRLDELKSGMAELKDSVGGEVADLRSRVRKLEDWRNSVLAVWAPVGIVLAGALGAFGKQLVELLR